jgi:hypothetical protein
MSAAGASYDVLVDAERLARLVRLLEIAGRF